LLHRQGRTWAEIGRLVGQRKLSVTADTYTDVLSDGRELEYEECLAEALPHAMPRNSRQVGGSDLTV
jgi:hypothetical protein